MSETNSTNNTLKKVLTHVIGWPLFLALIYLCVMKEGAIAWAGVRIVAYMANIDQSQSIYTIVVIVSHAITRFILSFFIAYLFSIFIFRQKRSRMIFSLAISFLFALFILWFAYNFSKGDYNRDRNYQMECMLKGHLGHLDCASWSEQYRKQIMEDYKITEKDLDTYRKKYLEE